jgi:hypothetical protein
VARYLQSALAPAGGIGVIRLRVDGQEDEAFAVAAIHADFERIGGASRPDNCGWPACI